MIRLSTETHVCCSVLTASSFFSILPIFLLFILILLFIPIYSQVWKGSNIHFYWGSGGFCKPLQELEHLWTWHDWAVQRAWAVWEAPPSLCHCRCSIQSYEETFEGHMHCDIWCVGGYLLLPPEEHSVWTLKLRKWAQWQLHLFNGKRKGSLSQSKETIVQNPKITWILLVRLLFSQHVGHRPYSNL